MDKNFVANLTEIWLPHIAKKKESTLIMKKIVNIGTALTGEIETAFKRWVLTTQLLIKTIGDQVSTKYSPSSIGLVNTITKMSEVFGWGWDLAKTNLSNILGKMLKSINFDKLALLILIPILPALCNVAGDFKKIEQHVPTSGRNKKSAENKDGPMYHIVMWRKHTTDLIFQALHTVLGKMNLFGSFVPGYSSAISTFDPSPWLASGLALTVQLDNIHDDIIEICSFIKIETELEKDREEIPDIPVGKMVDVIPMVASEEKLKLEYNL